MRKKNKDIYDYYKKKLKKIMGNVKKNKKNEF